MLHSQGLNVFGSSLHFFVVHVVYHFVDWQGFIDNVTNVIQDTPLCVS